MPQEKTLRTTDVVLVIDHSSSMYGYRASTAQELLLKLISQFAEEEHKGNDAYRVRLIGFSDTVVRTVARPASVWTRELIEKELPHTGGNTALRDAIGVSLEFALKSEAEACLIHVLTDGEENRSVAYGLARLQALLTEAEKTGRVTVALTGPSSALNYLANVGIPPGNFQAWDGGDREMPQVIQQTVNKTKDYIGLRAGGQTVSKSYYADPTALTPIGLKANTATVKPQDHRTVTPKFDGRSIADFYGTQFRQGSHYYELVKGEYLREDVDLVVRNNATGEYRVGSANVRALLGLPPTGRIRVNPKRSPDWTVFVQSQSNNRKLVLGQQLITL